MYYIWDALAMQFCVPPLMQRNTSVRSVGTETAATHLSQQLVLTLQLPFCIVKLKEVEWCLHVHSIYLYTRGATERDEEMKMLSDAIDPNVHNIVIGDF